MAKKKLFNIFPKLDKKYLKEQKEKERLSKAYKEQLKQSQENKKLFMIKKITLTKKLDYYNWNYFVTFTYNDKLHKEASFKKKLTKMLRLLEDKKWVYIGIWEKESTEKRLHFHGIFFIPENAMVGELLKRKDFNTKSHKTKAIHLNSFFARKFGRNDFSPIGNSDNKRKFAKDYILRQLEKSSSAVISSKDLDNKFKKQISTYEIENELKELNKNRKIDSFTTCDNGFLIGEFNTEKPKETVGRNNFSFAVFREHKRNSLAGKGNTKQLKN